MYSIEETCSVAIKNPPHPTRYESLQEIHKFVVQIYNSDGRYFNLQSGSKKLFVYHGTLSWVEDSSDDVRSLNVIHDGPEYFCTEPTVTFYILAVTLGKLKGTGERFVILTFIVSVLPYLIISFLGLLVGFRVKGKPPNLVKA